MGEAEAAGGVVASSSAKERCGHVDFFGEVDGAGDDDFGVSVVFDFCDCFRHERGVCCLVLFIVDCDGMWRVESGLRGEQGREGGSGLVSMAIDGYGGAVDDDFGTGDHQSEEWPFSNFVWLSANMSRVVEANVAMDLDEASLLLSNEYASYVRESGVDGRDISLAIDDRCCGLGFRVDDQ